MSPIRPTTPTFGPMPIAQSCVLTILITILTFTRNFMFWTIYSLVEIFENLAEHAPTDTGIALLFEYVYLVGVISIVTWMCILDAISQMKYDLMFRDGSAFVWRQPQVIQWNAHAYHRPLNDQQAPRLCNWDQLYLLKMIWSHPLLWAIMLLMWIGHANAQTTPDVDMESTQKGFIYASIAVFSLLVLFIVVWLIRQLNKRLNNRAHVYQITKWMAFCNMFGCVQAQDIPERQLKDTPTLKGISMTLIVTIVIGFLTVSLVLAIFMVRHKLEKNAAVKETKTCMKELKDRPDGWCWVYLVSDKEEVQARLRDIYQPKIPVELFRMICGLPKYQNERPMKVKLLTHQRGTHVEPVSNPDFETKNAKVLVLAMPNHHMVGMITDSEVMV